MKKIINRVYYKTKIGELVIGSYENKICIVGFVNHKKRDFIDNKVKKYLCADFAMNEDDIIKQCKVQIDEYLDGERKEFDLELLFVGTKFQKEVYLALKKVKYGYTLSYSRLASMIGRPRAFRAVASANANNNIAIILPCHRIIRSNGAIGQYGGGAEVKNFLIDLESSNT